MYRLTITQASNKLPYIVVDCDTLDQCTQCLKDYKKRRNNKFINYDIIKVDEILVDSSDLEDIDFSELEKEEEYGKNTL